jgi:D-alanine--poly(phosphoribitol) ligase subunit 2
LNARTRAEVEEKLRSFVEEHFLVEFGRDFDTATNLFETQIIDSFGFVELVQFLERDFKVKIQDSDLLSGELTSIDGITNLVETRTYEGISA